MTDEPKNESTAMVPVAGSGMLASPSVRDFLAKASDYAKGLAGVINSQKLYADIQGRKYVTVEGWTTLTAMMGITPHVVETIPDVEGGYSATVELRNAAGDIIARADAECGGPGEPAWNARVPNARRSMAQTRATSKACRLAFSWIMTMSGYEVTPAEEMQAHMEGSQRAPEATNEAPPAPPEEQAPNCPNCGTMLRRSKYPDKDDGDLGWYCWKKRGGCGNQYKSYQVGPGTTEYAPPTTDDVIEGEVVDDDQQSSMF